MASTQFILDLGSITTSFVRTDIFNDQSNVSEEITQRVSIQINGIEFYKPTCTLAKQTVELDPITTSALVINTRASSNYKNFQLTLNCDGYLNQRNFTSKFVDHYNESNMVSFGYLSNAHGLSYSNVGVQIRDRTHQPIAIGTEQELFYQVSGQQFSQDFNVRYFLVDDAASAGLFNAQASIEVNYR